jgi:hypothetical protein
MKRDGEGGMLRMQRYKPSAHPHPQERQKHTVDLLRLCFTRRALSVRPRLLGRVCFYSRVDSQKSFPDDPLHSCRAWPDDAHDLITRADTLITSLPTHSDPLSAHPRAPPRLPPISTLLPSPAFVLLRVRSGLGGGCIGTDGRVGGILGGGGWGGIWVCMWGARAP